MCAYCVVYTPSKVVAWSVFDKALAVEQYATELVLPTYN